MRAAWLLAGQLQKMVLVVSSAASKDVLERWTFDVLTDREAAAGQCAHATALERQLGLRTMTCVLHVLTICKGVASQHSRALPSA